MRLSVCLSVCWQDYSKTRAWIWMKCCVSTDIGTWTNYAITGTKKGRTGIAPTYLQTTHELINFWARARSGLYPVVRMSEPDCFLRYPMGCNAEFYYVGKIPRTGIGRPSLQQRVVLKCVLFTASHGNNFVGGTCALPSAFLVLKFRCKCKRLSLQL